MWSHSTYTHTLTHLYAECICGRGCLWHCDCWRCCCCCCCCLHIVINFHFEWHVDSHFDTDSFAKKYQPSAREMESGSSRNICWSCWELKAATATRRQKVYNFKTANSDVARQQYAAGVNLARTEIHANTHTQRERERFSVYVCVCICKFAEPSLTFGQNRAANAACCCTTDKRIVERAATTISSPHLWICQLMIFFLFKTLCWGGPGGEGAIQFSVWLSSSDVFPWLVAAPWAFAFCFLNYTTRKMARKCSSAQQNCRHANNRSPRGASQC